MAKRPAYGRYPAPVYEATFDDGTTGRMSFWSPKDKPIDFARGRRLLAWAYKKPIVSGVVDLKDGLNKLQDLGDAPTRKRPFEIDPAPLVNALQWIADHGAFEDRETIVKVAREALPKTT